jgi:hypothetical protein
MFEYITHKRRECFSFEREVRAVAFPPATPELGADHFQANRFESERAPGHLAYAPEVDLSRLINGIVFHPRAASEFEAKIIELCANNNLSCPTRSMLHSTLRNKI